MTMCAAARKGAASECVIDRIPIHFQIRFITCPRVQQVGRVTLIT